MKRALFLAPLLIVVVALVALRAFHSPGDQPELARSAPQAATSSNSSPLESLEPGAPALEMANAASAPSRQDLPTETNASAGARVPTEGATWLIKVIYHDSSRAVRGAKVVMEPSNAEARTGEQGTAELRLQVGVELTRLRVEACDDGDPFIPYAYALQHIVSPGKKEWLVVVDRGVDLSGVVREAGSGRAIPGAKVRYSGFGYRTQVESDKEGAFLCQALLVNYANPSRVNIECAGYLPASVKPQMSDLLRGAPPLLVLLESGLTVSGRVVDSNHDPVPGAYLQLKEHQVHQTLSDEQGNFRFEGIKPTEEALLDVRAQSKPAILEQSLALGALKSSRFDVVLKVERAVEVRVYAELPDGSTGESQRLQLGDASGRDSYSFKVSGLPSLTPEWFDVDWDDNGSPVEISEFDSETLRKLGTPHTRVVPLGREFEVRAFARAPGTDDPRAMLSGSARIHTDASTKTPIEVQIRLSELGRLEIPAPPAGAGENHRRDSSLLGALDVQVLDADSGLPIEEVNGIAYNDGSSTTEDLSPGPGGWIRIWHRLGSGTARIRHGDGPEERVKIAIPHSGYAKAEWRLRTKP